ncbi:sulfurtransferase [Limnohabitans sp. Jir61]|uniref:sulfurtransferase n=1 Tax=Limnohabitans sp. Jir61 TaxID=1826168 RepID=UPI000D33CC72|nr:sulfurtransferase [Limnohabitans sp. Jir61]PUE32617.1 sulfurtransferase [Limnohabitans sp. Jir61]
MNQILNISCYKFVALPDAQDLRQPCLDNAMARKLKGTILIAEEGINFFLAGSADDVHGFVDWLRSDARFADLAPKESWSDTQPFRKMLVKVKNEIIRMNHPSIRPFEGRAPAVTPETAKRWLDQGHDDDGRPVVTLDTRNQFEVDAGTFKNTINWGITKFTEFPDAVQAHLDELQDKTVISFCTGGIRCEKAAIYMRNAGLPHVYQLEGGILKYFEEVGNDHYDGGCFVFDERRAVGADLSATGLAPDGTFPTTLPTAPTPQT